MNAISKQNLTTQGVFFDGAWQDAAGPAIPVIDPATGVTFMSLPSATLADVDSACAAAAKAFRPWRALGGAARAGYLRAIAEGLRTRSELLADQIMRNIGKPRGDAEFDVADAIGCFEYYAELAEGFGAGMGEAVPLPDPSVVGQTYFEPYGPAALVIPWNFPLVTTAWKVAPALAVGCTVVLKPSEYATLAELVFGDIAIEANLPSGVLNIVTGYGDIGAALCQNPHIRKISFTGSNATGRRIMATAADRVVPVSLELGGKSPIVVLEDADLDEAARIVAAGIFFNAGQVCSATSRLIVAEGIADQLMERLLTKAQEIVVDGPDNADATMGPMTTEAQRDKVAEYFAIATGEGLTPLTGGHAIDRAGFFVAPTIYDDVPTDSRIWREEIFGPVLATRRFATDDEAIELANDSPFGLAATVIGKDAARLRHISDALEAGHVWHNTTQLIFPNTSWGGMKTSGIGRELGPRALAAFSAVKHVTRPAG